MSEGLRESLSRSNRVEAERVQARTEYIIQTLEANEPLLREVFITDDMPEEAVAKKLYLEVDKAFDWIAQQATRIIGITVFQRDPNNVAGSHPYAKLGWAKFHSLGGEPRMTEDGLRQAYTLHPTDEAKELVNRLRAIQGYESLEAQRDRQRASWESAIAAANNGVEMPGEGDSTVSLRS